MSRRLAGAAGVGSSGGSSSSLEDTEGRRRARFARARLRAGNRAARLEELDDEEDSFDLSDAGKGEAATAAEDPRRRLFALLRPLVPSASPPTPPPPPPSKGKKVAHLNALAAFFGEEQRRTRKGGEDQEEEELSSLTMLCLRVPLTDESAEVRAASLRALRTLLRRPSDARRMRRLGIPHLVARGMDLDLDNRAERVQALRVARRMAYAAPEQFPEAVARSLMSIAESGVGGGSNRDSSSSSSSSGDRMAAASLAVLCELSVLNSDLFVRCQGPRVLARCLLDCPMPRAAEAVAGALVRLHGDPAARRLGVGAGGGLARLDVAVAPFTEFRYVHQGEETTQEGGDGEKKPAVVGFAAAMAQDEADRERRFQCGRQAVLSLARSWGGLAQLAGPPPSNRQTPSSSSSSSSSASSSALAALVNTLYLPNAQIRNLVIDMLSDLLCVQTAFSSSTTAAESSSSASSSSSSNFCASVSLAAAGECSPLAPRDSWRLAEGFVAAEGLDLVPRMGRARPNLVDCHRSLLLTCLLRASLPDALVEVIVTSFGPGDSSGDRLAVRAVLLLSEVSHLAHSLIPSEVATAAGTEEEENNGGSSSVSGCLPSLLAHVSSEDPVKANRATETVSALEDLHALRRKRGSSAASSHSLFLEEILLHGGATGDASSSSGASAEDASKSGVKVVGGGGGGGDARGAEDKVKSLKTLFFDSSGPDVALRIVESSGVLPAKATNTKSSSFSTPAPSSTSSSSSPRDWNWDVINSALSSRPLSDALSSGMDAGGGGGSIAGGSPHYRFARRIVEFYRPSANKFAKVDLTDAAAETYARTGCTLVTFLLTSKSSEAARLLDELLLEIKNQFQLLIGSKSSADCLFSPTRMATTTCQYYFLFLGRLSRFEEGRHLLDKHQFMPIFLQLLHLSSDMYLKLALSSLDYSSVEWGSKALLSRACSGRGAASASAASVKASLEEGGGGGGEAARVYATKLLGLLVRTRTPFIAAWGIDLLVGLLFDQTSKVIPWLAFDLVDEACDDPMSLGSVLSALAPRGPLSSPLLGGDRGALLAAHLAASESGIKILQQTGRLSSQLRHWGDTFNLRYCGLTEDRLSDALTRHQRGADRRFETRRRAAHEARGGTGGKDAYLPPHLYGRLASTPEGAEVLARDSSVLEAVQNVRRAEPDRELNQRSLCELKSSLWSVCHVLSCPSAAVRVTGGERAAGECVAAVAALAERSPHMGLRATAFYALSLVASTRTGASWLRESAGWCSLRRGREQRWPVQEDWLLLARDRAAAARQDSSGSWSPDEPEESQRGLTASPPSAIVAPFAVDDSPSPGSNRGSSSFSARRRSGGRLARMFRSFSLGTSSSANSSAAAAAERLKKTAAEKKAAAAPQKREKDKEDAEETKDEESGGQAADGAGLSNIVEETPSANLDELAAAKLVVEQGDKEEEDVQQQEQEYQPASSSLEERGQGRLSPIASATALDRVGGGDGGGEEDEDDNDDGIEVDQGIDSDVATSVSKEATPERRRGPFPVDLRRGAAAAAARGRRRRHGGQRALSESEASNFSVVYEADPAAVCARPGGSDNVHARTYVGGAISSSSSQAGGGGGVKQGHSVTSVSSVGSWTDSPGYQTLRNLRSRRRPVLSESGEASSEKKALQGGGLVRREEEGGEWHRRARTLDFRLLRQQQQQRQRDREQQQQQQQRSRRLRSRTVGGASSTNQDSSAAVVGSGGPEPRYLGICLPLQPWKLFQLYDDDKLSSAPLENSRETEAKEVQEENRDGLLPRSLTVTKENGHHQNEEEASSPSKSPSDDSSRFSAGRRKEIMRLVNCMNASVGVRTAEQGLLRAKQKYPEAFDDLVLYSEVCELLSGYPIRLGARRFLQELFVNLDFSSLAEEPAKALMLMVDKKEDEEEKDKAKVTA